MRTHPQFSDLGEAGASELRLRYSQSLGSESSGAHMKPARQMPPAIGGASAVWRKEFDAPHLDRDKSRDDMDGIGAESRARARSACAPGSRRQRCTERQDALMPRPRRLNQDCSLLDEIPQDTGGAEDPQGTRTGPRRPATATAISAPAGRLVPRVRASEFRGTAPLQSANASSSTFVRRGSSAVTSGEKRAMTLPSRPITNFSKFHSTSVSNAGLTP